MRARTKRAKRNAPLNSSATSKLPNISKPALTGKPAPALVAVRPTANDAELSAKIVNNTLRLCHDVRISGATALDLAYVAAGKLDGVIAPATMLASMAAGILLVKEAGGLVLDMEQEDTRTEDLPMVLNSGNLMAASFNLSQKIAKILK